jgi:hypothetical protein
MITQSAAITGCFPFITQTIIILAGNESHKESFIAEIKNCNCYFFSNLEACYLDAKNARHV